MLNKIIFLSLSLSMTSMAYASDQVKLFGFGKTPQELVTEGYKAVVKSSGNEIYEKRNPSVWYKIVSKKNEYVSRLYRDSTGLYSQYTKLDSKGKVLGQVQCKNVKPQKTTSCDVQTAGICKELITKVEAGGFDIDLKKIKECAEISGKVNYSRTGTEEMLTEATKELTATAGALAPIVKSTPSSLQTLLKDYSACKAVESELSEDSDTSAAAIKSSADTTKGTH